MAAPAWLVTTSGKFVAAASVVLLVATAGVTIDTFNLLGSNSNNASTNGGGTITPDTAKVQPSPSATPCNNGNGNGNANGNCVQGSDNKTFTVTGSITQLVPGAPRNISLSLTNNASQAINVRTITVQAADGRDALGVVVCTATNLLLGTAGTAGSGTISPTALQIAGGATTTGVNFPVRLAPTAGNGCKNVTWQLTYSGTADQA
jgi:hypothetical protein